MKSTYCGNHFQFPIIKVVLYMYERIPYIYCWKFWRLYFGMNCQFVVEMFNALLSTLDFSLLDVWRHKKTDFHHKGPYSPCRPIHSKHFTRKSSGDLFILDFVFCENKHQSFVLTSANKLLFSFYFNFWGNYSLLKLKTVALRADKDAIRHVSFLQFLSATNVIDVS